MILRQTEGGYTIVEMVVTLFIMGIFLTMFFQLYLTTDSQRISAMRLAAANDLAQTNLRKITNRTQVAAPLGSTAAPEPDCSSDTSTNNPNNLLYNPNAAGSDIKFTADPLTSGLPPSTTQSMKVLYPQGCGPLLPFEIISKVIYGTETVVRASYINN